MSSRALRAARAAFWASLGLDVIMVSMADLEVRVNRSSRRQKSVAARLVEGGTVLEVTAPDGMSEADLAPVIDKLREQLLRRQAKAKHADDAALAQRAADLNREYFDGKLKWTSMRFVTNQQHRFGSCTPATGAIRISHRLATMPAWVRDYVLVHELAHLVEANHGPRFWKLVNRYPRTERARGYLMAVGLESEDGAPDENADLE
jgi:predicted metal-dependent hydrolase